MRNLQKPLFFLIIAFLFISSVVSCEELSETTNSPTIESQGNETEEIQLGYDDVSLPPNYSAIKISLNQLVDDDNILSYSLSEDHQFIILQTETAYFQFDLDTYQLSPASWLSAQPSKTPTPLESMLEEIKTNAMSDETIYYSLSPDKTEMFFWTSTILQLDGKPYPTATFDPDPIAVEAYNFIIETTIYLLDKTSSSPVLIGKVNGFLDDVFWLSAHGQAVFEMSLFSSNFLWLIDLTDLSLTPLVSNEQVNNSGKLGVLDISPNEQEILYQYHYEGKQVSIFNIDKMEIKNLADFPSSIGAWWLPDGNGIVANALKEPDTNSLIIYNVQTQETEKILLEIERYSIPKLLKRTTNGIYLINNLAEGQYDLLIITID